MGLADPISPELALVCPELRERALAQLPPPGLGHVVRRPAPLLAAVTVAGPPEVARAEGPPLVVAALAYAGIRIARDLPLYALMLLGVYVLTLLVTAVG